MRNRFCGSVNSLSGEYCRLMDSSPVTPAGSTARRTPWPGSHVDFVDDQDVSSGRVSCRHLGEVTERPARSVKVRVPLPPGSAGSLEEVLVRVRRVELDELDRAVVGQVPGQLAGEVSLASARRPVQDDLPALPQQIDDLSNSACSISRSWAKSCVIGFKGQLAPGWFRGRRGRLSARAARDKSGQLLVGLGQVDDVGLALQQGRYRGAQLVPSTALPG